MVHCLLFFPIIIAFLLRVRNIEKLYVIPFIIICIFASLRYGFASDYFNYQNMYNSIQSGYKGDIEYLFMLLNRIIPSYYLLVAVTTVAFIAIIYWFIKKNVEPEYIWVSVLIFVINTFALLINLSAMRQCLAMILFIVAIEFAKKKNFLAYAMIILIAVMFHRSAILLLPVYFIANDKPVGKVTVLFIVAIIALALSGDLIPYFADFFARDVMNDANYVHYASSAVTNSLRATLLSSVFMIYVLFNLTRLDGNALVYAKLYLMATIFSVLAIKLSMVTRMQMYFDIFSVVALPMILKKSVESDAVIYRDNIVLSAWNILNKYAFPILIFTIYGLRYYSFFTNPLWKSFTEYRTIFSIL